MEKITIYTQSTCGYCKTIKDELVKNNIKFIEILVDKSMSKWNDIVSLTSLATTPTIDYMNNYFIPGRDYTSPEQLVIILKNFKKSEFSESRQVLEKVKTLGSSINIAFGRLDQILKQIKKNTKKE